MDIMRLGQDYDLMFKLLIFGDGGVGKTTLTQRYLTGVFNESQRLTIGVEFYVKALEIDGKRIKIQIWDFGGEERFRFLLPEYCRGANGGLFVYDVTQERTLAHLPDWLEVLHNNAPNISLLMVGTKADLELKRQVQKQEAVKVAKAHEMAGFAEVSAKTGANVNSVFETIAKIMVKRAK